MDFKGKTAVVSGAASGMGLVFSESFARLGGNVLMCDVNEERLKEAVEKINSQNCGKAEGCICDVRNYDEVCAARDKAVEKFGSIDILTNFAGGTAVRMLNVDPALEFPDIPISVYDWGLDVNLKGQFYFAHAVMKQMREQKSGLIVNIGSITGKEGDGRGMEYLKNDFKLAYDNFSVPEKSFKVLGIFYNVLDRIIPNIKKSPEKRMSTSVKKAVQYITVNYEKNITVSELSEIANLSPSRFFSVFKTETGTTPIEYKNRIAVRNAKKLLLYSELTIEEICEKLGFNSASYFRRTFKKFTGKSPREYRHDMTADLKL